MINLPNNRAFAWCLDHNVYAGGPLSYIGELEGYPLVKRFDGNNFCGISLHNVVKIDNYQSSPTSVMCGGLIELLNYKDFITRKDYFKNSDTITINSYIKPTKDGLFKIQKKKTKKTIGVVSKVDEYFVCVKALCL